MSGVIHIEAGRSFPVSAREGFDYVTDPRNWIEYWPRAVSVDPDARRREPGDHAGIVLRMLGRRGALDMTLVRIDHYRLVEYTSEQDGLPAAHHWRHFDEDDGQPAVTFKLPTAPVEFVAPVGRCREAEPHAAGRGPSPRRALGDPARGPAPA